MSNPGTQIKTSRCPRPMCAVMADVQFENATVNYKCIAGDTAPVSVVFLNGSAPSTLTAGNGRF